MVFVEVTEGVVAARPIGSDDVDSVEITVGRLEVELEEVVDVVEELMVEVVEVEEEADGAVVTVVVVVEVVVVVVS